jgi:DNA-3-methyladenine glycosylase I
MTRCPWAEAGNALMRDYHDHEWGVPLHDDRALFEFLCLEGAQAGLAWRTVLDKRARYREVFHNFDIARVAAMSDAELAQRLADPGIIRNRRKIAAMRDNARVTLAVIDECGSLDGYLWSFTEGTPITNHWQSAGQVPATTAISDRMSRDMKKHGFRFVGTTICYAHMQATGMVNDHLTGCFRHAPCAASG